MQNTQLRNINDSVLAEIKYFLLLGYNYEGMDEHDDKLIFLRKKPELQKNNWYFEYIESSPMHYVGVNLHNTMNKITTRFICQKAEELLFSEYSKYRIEDEATFKHLDKQQLAKYKDRLDSTENNFDEKVNILLEINSNINNEHSHLIKEHISNQMKKLISDGFDVSKINYDLAFIDKKTIYNIQKIKDEEAGLCL